MSQTATTDGLYTRVKNTSGVEKSFGFLGHNGVRLAADATYDHPGDLTTQLARKPRAWDSFCAALEAGELEIVYSPATYLQDRETDDTRELALDDSALGTVSPRWDADGDDEFVPGSGE